MPLRKQQLIDEDSLLGFFDYLAKNMPKGIEEMNSQDHKERGINYETIKRQITSAITEFGMAIVQKTTADMQKLKKDQAALNALNIIEDQFNNSMNENLSMIGQWFAGLGGAIEQFNKGVGACMERAFLLYAATIKLFGTDSDVRVELIQAQFEDFPTYNHVFILVNREKNSDMQEPNTWGENCLMLDPTRKYFKYIDQIDDLDIYGICPPDKKLDFKIECLIQHDSQMVSAAIKKLENEKYPLLNDYLKKVIGHVTEVFQVKLDEKLKKLKIPFPKLKPYEELNSRLRTACALGNLEKVEKLLAEGANPNATDEQKRSALHYAVMRFPLVKDLSKNLSLKLSDDELKACCKRHPQIVSLLLNYPDIDVELKHIQGSTAEEILEKHSKATTGDDAKIMTECLALLKQFRSDKQKVERESFAPSFSM